MKLLQNLVYTLLFTIPSTYAVDTVSVLMSSGHKGSNAHPTTVSVIFTFKEGRIFAREVSYYETTAQVIENTDEGIRAVVNLKEFPEDIRKKLNKLLKPTSDYLVIMPELTNNGSNVIITDVGLEGGKEQGGAAMGTPGNIMYKEKYLGTLYHPSASTRPGAARRTVFCKGPCVWQQEPTQ